ncbi:MAG TPA: Fe-S cluster assembly protein SufD [Gammaproteobacteria bacterium]|nr:Fe-S cluster assembly protein SufD [Gammaproteobacteria bacterium]
MTDATPLPLIERPLPGARVTWPARRAALAELEVAGWPQKRQERWRYTDLEPLRRDDFATAPPPGDAERRAAGALLARAAGTAPRLAFVDGHFCSELSSVLPAGLEALDLDARWSEFEGRWAGHVATKDHPLAALNTAFSQHGLWLRVAPGCVVDAPVHVVHVGSSRERLAAQPRLVIEVGERARITLIEQIVDAGAGSGWLNSVVQLRQAAGSHVDLYRLQRHGERQAHTSLLTADLAAEAELTAGYVDLGSRLARNDVDITLRERGARAELFGLFVPGPGQHIDNHTTIVHAAPETRSDEAFRGVIGERGHGVFNGKVVVRPKAQRIDARQSNDNLLLGEHCEIDTKPELEIYADDVKCSHGSTVGELDADQLFYLRARGIDAADAREMLTSAFAASVLERVRDAAFRQSLLDLVTARLRTLAEEPT